MQRIAAVLVVAVSISCASSWEAISRPHTDASELTTAERAELEKAIAAGASTSVPTLEGEAAWGRAQYWVSKFSTMKVETVSPYLLVTHNPTEWYPKPQYGYQVNRVKIADAERFEVECLYPSTYVASATGVRSQTPPRMVERMKKDCAVNAAIAAHFIESGELLCARCIAQ